MTKRPLFVGHGMAQTRVRFVERTYYVWSRKGQDYGWHRLGNAELERLRDVGCRCDPAPMKDMRGKRWLPGRSR